MSCNGPPDFKGIKHFGDPTVSVQLEHNLKHWLDWSFLRIGAWREVAINSSGHYGGNMSELLESNDTGFADRVKFSGLRKDWIYESGVNYCSPTQPIASLYLNTGISKVRVDLGPFESSYYKSGDSVTIEGNPALTGTFTVFSSSGQTLHINSAATGSGAGGTIFGQYSPPAPRIVTGAAPEPAYDIDYPNGQVIFATPILSSLTPKASYSYRLVQTYIAGDADLELELQFDSQDPSSPSVEDEDRKTGDFSQEPVSRIQLPAITIETIPSRSTTGYELGSEALNMKQDVLFTVYAQNKNERDLITDILAGQKSKTLTLYNIQRASQQNKLPLTHEGYLNPSGNSYLQLVQNPDLYWTNAYVFDTNISEVSIKSTDLYMSKVRMKLEIIR